jgi:hypothetical protein
MAVPVRPVFTPGSAITPWLPQSWQPERGTMFFTFQIDVEVERTEGKFASKVEIAERIMEALESADEGTWEGDDGGQYETTVWEVSDVTPLKRNKKGSTNVDSVR